MTTPDNLPLRNDFVGTDFQAGVHPTSHNDLATVVLHHRTRLAGLTRVRSTATYTTASLVFQASEFGLIQLTVGYRLYAMTVSRLARVRLYDTVAHRDADVARAPGVRPLDDHGLMFDYVAASVAQQNVTLSPVVDGFDGQSTPTGNVPITVNNLGATGTVAVTLTFLRTE